ncbi:unnamed protein product [Hymenolepis diminuta]|uniref:DUF5727 domain-containing protein n=1 Tax=Hymenolepis diminuta TaxID=6216 RepID=A0A564ZB87_HYMDI|nr:unnamed protein product [Hymenolepis diminuta]
MYFKWAHSWWANLRKSGSKRVELLTIENGNCILNGSIIGSPCEVQAGEIIVEKSIPLYRFLHGKTEENVIFAVKGTDYNGLLLNRDDSIICNWKYSIPEKGVCANLTVDEVNGLTIFNATFSKSDDIDYDTYTWRQYSHIISVHLDWTNSGEAPEVKACGKSDD